MKVISGLRGIILKLQERPETRFLRERNLTIFSS